jgi:Glycosyl hydrolase family 79 C-terminal beta domain
VQRRRGRIGIVAALTFFFGVFSAQPGPADQPDIELPVVSAQVAGPATGPAMPPGFLGFSFETRALHIYTGRDPTAVNPVLVQLIRALNPGQTPILRIGGDSTDQTWWPTPGVIPPGGITYGLTKGWMRTTRALATATGAKLIIGVNLAANRPALAAQEARAIIEGIGRPDLAALEIGNEADLYGQFAWYKDRRRRVVRARPSNYNLTAFIHDFARWRAAMPTIPLAGPAFAGTTWMDGLNTFLDAEQDLSYVTFHRYPLRGCTSDPTSPSFASIPNLLADVSSAGLAQQVVPYVNTTHTHGLSFRLDELNSAACTGRSGVSDTFASSLWVLDTLFNLAAVGVDGINVHTLPNAAYEPFSFTHQGKTWKAFVRPIYYGMMMFADAFPPGARLLTVSAPPGPVKVWATVDPAGQLHVVVINKDPSVSVSVQLQLPGSGAAATVESLNAPSLSATAGVALGGQTFGNSTRTGKLAGRLSTAQLTPLQGTYTVTLPAGSAVMLSR